MDLFDQRTADMRLHNCIIRIENTPIFIDRVEKRDSNFLLTYRVLGQTRPNIIFFEDPSINIEPVPLGFTLVRGETVNVLRQPARMYKIGLCSSNIIILGSGSDRLSISNVRSRHLLESDALAKTIQGHYLSCRQAIAALKDGGRMIPFSRDFAMRSDGRLIHRFTGVVGSTRQNQKLRLYDRYQYLKESLEIVV